MSIQVKRSAVNALVVELIIERDNLQKQLNECGDARAKAYAEIAELHFRMDKIQENKASINDQLFALQDELSVLKESMRFSDNDRLKLSWYQYFIPNPFDGNPFLNMEPFGVKGGMLVDPMDGDKIPTIKLVRELTGLGLKEAKDIVDGWEKDGKFKKWSAE